MRAVSELVALLVLVGATAVALASALIIVPQYFQQYNRVALQASQAVSLSGYRTESVLVRHCSASHCSLIVLVYNTEANPTRVSYHIYCEASDGRGKHFVGKEEGVVIQGGGRYAKAYQNIPRSAIDGAACYLIVEEPNLLTYKTVG